MNEQQHHEELIKGISEQLKSILEKSDQAIYIYLDDAHKVCNKKFADLLGYKSAKEWADTEAPLADVVADDQARVVSAFEGATKKMVASSLEVRLKSTMTGKQIKTNLILVPIAYKDHLFALHFISKI